MDGFLPKAKTQNRQIAPSGIVIGRRLFSIALDMA